MEKLMSIHTGFSSCPMNGDSQFSDSEVSRQLETAIKDMFVSSTDKTVEKKKV